jgi:hypothetical protein
MSGSIAYPLSAQIADTARVHGLPWAAAYYARRGVPLDQFMILARGAGLI